jgi:hypothetical protein
MKITIHNNEKIKLVTFIFFLFSASNKNKKLCFIVSTVFWFLTSAFFQKSDFIVLKNMLIVKNRVWEFPNFGENGADYFRKSMSGTLPNSERSERAILLIPLRIDRTAIGSKSQCCHVWCIINDFEKTIYTDIDIFVVWKSVKIELLRFFIRAVEGFNYLLFIIHH